MKIKYPVASGFYTKTIELSKVTIIDEFSETPLDMYVHGLRHSIQSLEERIEFLERISNDLVVAINLEKRP